MAPKQLIMKYILAPFTFIAVTMVSCKKDNVTQPPQFADMEFSIYDIRPPADTAATEMTYPNILVLRSDYTWTIDLEGATSKGTYTWTPTSERQGEIKFTILSWTVFAPDLILSDKLKSALQAVNHFGYSLQSPAIVNFLANNYQGEYFPFIRTNKL